MASFAAKGVSLTAKGAIARPAVKPLTAKRDVTMKALSKQDELKIQVPNRVHSASRGCRASSK